MQVDDIVKSIGFQTKFDAADDDLAKQAEAVSACQAALLAFADKPRKTFRRLMPNGPGGQLQRDLMQLAAAFFDCVVSDVRTNKAELGSVWKSTLKVVSKEGGPEDAQPEAAEAKPNQALKSQLCTLEDKIKGAQSMRCWLETLPASRPLTRRFLPQACRPSLTPRLAALPRARRACRMRTV